MAFTSLLDIIQRATDELGLPRPVAVAASPDPQVKQLFALTNAVGRDLMRAHEWTALVTLGTNTTVPGTADYALPDDYDRMVADTAWDRTNDRFMLGPDTVQLNRYLNESGTAQATINKRYRLRGGTITVWPTPDAAETLVYEYVSNTWARSSGGAAQAEFIADTDTTVFDPDLVKAELKWRFMSAKGMYSEPLFGEAMRLRDQRIAFDIGGRRLDMGCGAGELPLVGDGNIPDGNWNL